MRFAHQPLYSPDTQPPYSITLVTARDMPPVKSSNPNRRSFLLGTLAAGAAAALPAEASPQAESNPATRQERTYWLQQVELVSNPVLKALKEGTLRRKMPVEAAPGQAQARAVGTHFE